MKEAKSEVDIGKNVKKIIDRNGLKQKAVAAKAGYTEQVFSNLINGRKIMSAYDVIKISSALDVMPNEILGIGK